MRGRPERITEGMLRAAYAREAGYHPSWPRTVEGMLADPLMRGVLVAIVRASLPAYRRRQDVPIATMDGTGRAETQFILAGMGRPVE